MPTINNQKTWRNKNLICTKQQQQIPRIITIHIYSK